MRQYSVDVKIVPDLPDGRLYMWHFDPKRIRLYFKEGHASRQLVAHLKEFMNHLAWGEMMTYDPAQAGKGGNFTVDWVRVDPDLLFDQPFRVIARPPAYEWLCNKHHLTKDLRDQIVAGMPEHDGVLRLKGRPAEDVALIGKRVGGQRPVLIASPEADPKQ